MGTIEELYAILRKRGLNEQDIQQFLRIIEDYLTKGQVTKEDLKATENSIKEELKSIEDKPLTDLNKIENVVNESGFRVREEAAKIESYQKGMERRLNEKFFDMEKRLVRWLLGLIIASTTIVIAILKLFLDYLN